MSLIDQRCFAVFKSITIRSITAYRHQNDGMITTKAELHSTLKAGAFPPTHFVMRENVA